MQSLALTTKGFPWLSPHKELISITFYRECIEIELATNLTWSKRVLPRICDEDEQRMYEINRDKYKLI
jgi:hypothetical protein